MVAHGEGALVVAAGLVRAQVVDGVGREEAVDLFDSVSTTEQEEGVGAPPTTCAGSATDGGACSHPFFTHSRGEVNRARRDLGEDWMGARATREGAGEGTSVLAERDAAPRARAHTRHCVRTYATLNGDQRRAHTRHCVRTYATLNGD